MGSFKQQQIKEHEKEEADFAIGAKINNYECKGSHRREPHLIEKSDYDGWKVSGRCAECNHDIETAMKD